MNGSQPPWSRDGWSFAPLDLSQLEIPNPPQNSSIVPATNISVVTPAIRGRIECSPYENLNNLSAWVTERDLTNTSLWNASSNPHNIKTAYELGELTYVGSDLAYPNFFNTSILADDSTPTCCENGSTNSWPPKGAAIGNWSPDRGTTFEPPFNFTTKYIWGNHFSADLITDNIYTSPTRFLFTDVPQVQALKCMPIIEKSSANVTVDRQTGNVAKFDILERPSSADEAWRYNFVDYGGRDEVKDPTAPSNISVSYGVLFLLSMLRAASINGYTGWDFDTVAENTDDMTFNFRDRERGLNFDFMTYAMYTLASSSSSFSSSSYPSSASSASPSGSNSASDPHALLSATTMLSTAQTTFTTFFQHFVSSNLSATTLTAGSWAWQPLAATLAGCLWNYTGATCADPVAWPTQQPPTERAAEVVAATRISLLRMNDVAVWMALGILGWLVATTGVVGVVGRRGYWGRLRGDVACVADVLVLVAGSAGLLQALREGGGEVVTKLGWFEGGGEEARWGVEVVDGRDED
ncbi:hypothetical protein DIS24_g1201 [Lasiodiplodia hormozganensis]|uniref:Uncharacterized protein n=1 Tax=Lasiodiplodia hormozganensis TaxID=869390 RepID=A0AA40D662_9PEZI|nr:hypothetical protein DIS24_g1201 [Lasiodiplodia hormozganensis]